MPLLFRHIRTRMMLVFLLLLALVLGAVLVAVYRASLANAQDQVKTEFDMASKTFARLMVQRAEFLTQGVAMLAGDSAFKQALRDADLAKVESLLNGHAQSFKASMAMLVSLDGRFLVNTRYPDAFGEPFPCKRMLQVAQDMGGSTGYVRIEDQAFQVVLAPVLSPEPVAWLALGFPVNDATARDFEALTGTGVNFMSVGDEGARVLASSLHGGTRVAAMEWLAHFSGEDYRMRRTRLGGQEYWTHFVKLDSASALDYVAALTLSLDEAMAPYERLRGTLLLISIIAMLAFVYGASLLAGRLTKPIQDLVYGVRRVGRGHYGTRVSVNSKDELGTLAAGFNYMVGEINVRERQISFLAYHDALTGMPNRACFIKDVDALLKQGKPGPAVMLVACLARLRVINVSLGFAVAEGLVKRVAQRIQGREGWQVASLGGEKFAFFCPLSEQADRDEWEVRVRAVLEVPVEWQGQRFDLGMHLGSALYPDDGHDAEMLLRRAEHAMQRGTHSVGTHVVYLPEFESGGARRLALLNDLREGIEAGQLLAHYQPKARLADGGIVACELLIRWHHPRHGLVLPEDFIPVAEQSSLIHPLAHWVIEAAAAQAALWRAARREIVVCFNLSARNLMDHAVVERMANALARHDLPPGALIAEITESAFMEDPETALSVVNAIAALGVTLSIDDFGAGYSNLLQLARLPARELKIDKAIVQHMLASGKEAAIVKSTIDLAHTLGLSVVAEGVETLEHWQRLLAYGCDVAQGDYLSAPVEVAAFETWLAEREA